MKHIIPILFFFSSSIVFSQDKNGAQLFREKLQSLCGKAFEGKLIAPAEDPQFSGKSLIMHVRYCSDSLVKIPFFVGDDKSRTWILTYYDDRIELKHDHRHADGTKDKITMYGGATTNTGQATSQVFSADQHTSNLIPPASSNIWWITITDSVYSYNLRRVDTSRFFSIEFDLTKPIAPPDAPWGWSDD